MKSFQFATATQVVFGRGSVQRLPELVSPHCRRPLWVTGADRLRFSAVGDKVRGHGLTLQAFSVPSEPTTELVAEGLQVARETSCDAIIAIGGGSAIDAGKAIAALLTNGGTPLDYLEVVGQAKRIFKASAPFFAIPTTSGTGAEVTKNAVLESKEHGVKVSLRSALMLPKLALVDSELTHTLSPEVTAATGLDALTQCLEPYVSRYRNPLTDCLCLEGMRRAARALERAFSDGSDADARDDMALTSLFGGLALANAKLGAVHGFAGPIGGLLDAPHGAVCARLLPEVMTSNIEALRQRAAHDPVLERYRTVARVLTGRDNAQAENGIQWVRALRERLRIPTLATYGLTPGHIGSVVSKAKRASSMQGNPIELTTEELSRTLEAAL